jgi:penicillin G amidase
VTANNRVVGGNWLAMLGDGGYDPGARARQIRDDLLRIPRPALDDMLAVQLDDRALLLARWRSLALRVLTTAAVSNATGRTQFRELLLNAWTGRASVNSVGYRLVRQFRTVVAELALAPFVSRARQLDPTFPSTPGRALEGPVWALVTQQPLHLLDRAYATWDALLLDGVDKTVALLTEGGRRRLDERTWGEANTTLVQHTLARAVPRLAWWLDMPPYRLPGDVHVPRVQTVTFGASERLAVSPGHEAGGYFHMPAGQSGHPLSPHYRDGHDDWAYGRRASFLPGPARSTLSLVPARPASR